MVDCPSIWIALLLLLGAKSFVLVSRKPSSSVCHLNRILFFDYELDNNQNEVNDGHHSMIAANVTLAKDDYRTKHVKEILKLSDGDTIRTGIVSCNRFPDGLTTDESTIHWIDNDHIRFCLVHLTPPTIPQSRVSLILALPRPLQLSRILPMVAQMGVHQLVLTDARKVPKDYFGSHLLRTPQELTDRLVEGLTQSGDVRLPRIHIVRNFRKFLDHDLHVLFPQHDCVRLLAHPSNNSTSIRQVNFDARECVVAVGPEGGWEEEREVPLILDKGFRTISMGARILRTDCAVVSLLALAQDRIAETESPT